MLKVSVVAVVACMLCAAACGRSEAERAQLAATCASAGAQTFERYKARLSEQYQGASQLVLREPEFHYNSRLHTCLVKASIRQSTEIENERGQKEYFFLDEIVDAYSNKTILSSGYENRFDQAGVLKTTPIGEPLEFEQKAKALMRE